jgi:hypothetical protein
MNIFISNITNNKNSIDNRTINHPLKNNFSNTNRFRPTFNKRSARLRKFKKTKSN